MIIIPAIDILGGACVRLYQGDYGQSKVYGDDPVATARELEAAGVRRIHIVDLDAARGSGDNRPAIRSICESVSCTVEIGGGVRTERDVEELIEAGAGRIIVGTMLVRDPERVAAWARRFGNLIAGIDSRDGRVRVSGWEASSELSDEDVARTARSAGMISIIHTDIARDGALSGPAVERTAALGTAVGLPMILSGGVRGLEDIEAASRFPQIVGVIIGRAFYEGHIDLRDAVTRFGQEENEVNW